MPNNPNQPAPPQAPPNQAGQPLANVPSHPATASHDAMRAHLAGAGCPPEVADALLGPANAPRQAAGVQSVSFDKILRLIQLVQQYGPQAWQLVQTIIDLFKTPGAAPPNVAGQPASPR